MRKKLTAVLPAAILSLGVVLNFMYKKEPLDEVDVQMINETKQINVKETHAMGV